MGGRGGGGGGSERPIGAVPDDASGPLAGSCFRCSVDPAPDALRVGIRTLAVHLGLFVGQATTGPSICGKMLMRIAGYNSHNKKNAAEVGDHRFTPWTDSAVASAWCHRPTGSGGSTHLFRWTSGTLSRQGRLISHWVPFISSDLRRPLEMHYQPPASSAQKPTVTSADWHTGFAEQSDHICSVCSRLIATRTRPC